MIKRVLIVCTLFVLSGCVTNYYMFGAERYEDKDEFIQASTEKYAAVNRSIVPLPKPLTTKKLIIVVSSTKAVSAQSVKNVKNGLRRDPNRSEMERIETMALFGTVSMKAMTEAVKKKGIYSDVSLRESDTLINSLAAGPDYDTLVWYEEAANLGQWFYSDAKYGKQVFSWDRTSPSLQTNTEAFLASLQALAVRE